MRINGIRLESKSLSAGLSEEPFMQNSAGVNQKKLQ